MTVEIISWSISTKVWDRAVSRDPPTEEPDQFAKGQNVHINTLVLISTYVIKSLHCCTVFCPVVRCCDCIWPVFGSSRRSHSYTTGSMNGGSGFRMYGDP